MMSSWFVQAQGGHTTVALQQVEIPRAGPGELLVRVRAAGLNRGELTAGHGLAKPGPARPFGLEAAGEVVAIGPDVEGFAIGQAVLGRAAASLATFAVMHVREAVAMPAHLSWEQAAATPIAFIAASEMLIGEGRLAAGETLLITAISSGVGIAALQTGKLLGARVIGTSGSPDKLERLGALGLDVGLCTRLPDFRDALMRATDQRGADLVVNIVGGSAFAACLSCLAPRGRLATVGYVDGVMQAQIDLEAVHARRLKIFGMSNKFLDADQRAAAAALFKRYVMPAIADGRLRPVVDRIFDFDELPAARAYLESSQQLGKIVLRGP